MIRPRAKHRIELAVVWIVLVVAAAVGTWLWWQGGHIENCPEGGQGGAFAGGLVLLVVAFLVLLWVIELFRRGGDHVRWLYLALFVVVLLDAVLAFRYGVNVASAICD